MSKQLTLEFLADLPELARLNDAVSEFARAQDWSPESLFQIQLALEEVVVNVMSYGSEGGHLPKVCVKLRQQGMRLAIEIADDGIAFDPLQNAEPDLDASLDDRAVGGLGVYLVRQLMDTVDYQRDSGRNILSITKTLRTCL